MSLVHCPNISDSSFWQFSSSYVSCLKYSIILFYQTKFWSLDRYPPSPSPVVFVGDGTSVLVLFSRERCMFDPYMNLCPMQSETSFIEVEYSLVFYPPDQSKMKPFRSSHFPLKFISWLYVAFPGCRLQTVLVVRECFIPACFSTFALACLLVLI